MTRFAHSLAAGRLLLPGGNVLGATTTEAAFLAFDIGERSASGKGGGDHRNHGVRRLVLEDTAFHLRAYFLHGAILSVHLSATLPDDVSSWDDWTLEREMRRKDLHDAWLRARLGDGPWTYDWGAIWSSYDPRSGGSNWGINYRCDPPAG